MTDAIRIDVLGPLRVLVNGHDRADALSGPQRTIVAALAGLGPAGAIERQRLRRASGVAASSFDALLSRIRHRLGCDRHLHRSRAPAPGWIGLESSIDTDLDHVATAVARPDPPVTDLLAADRAWRGDPVPLVTETTDVGANDGPISQLRAHAWALRRRTIELLVAALSTDDPTTVDLARVAEWVADHPTYAPLRILQISAVTAQEDPESVAPLLERWRRDGAGDEETAAARAVIAGTSDRTRPPDAVVAVVDAARRGLERLEHRTVAEVLAPLRVAVDGRDRWRLTLTRAEALRLGAHWDEAEVEYRRALVEAERLDDVDAAAETLLALARIVWQAGPLADLVERRARQLLGHGTSPALTSELAALLAGGLHQSGVAVPDAAELVDRSMALLDRIPDPHRRAEALLRCRKGVLGIEHPMVQAARAERIVELAGTRADLRSAGLLARAVDALHAADLEAARIVAREHAELAAADPTGFVAFHQCNLETVFALADGRRVDADLSIDHAERIAQRMRNATVVEITTGQRLWSARLAGDRSLLDGFARLLDGIGDATHPLWHAANALVLTDLGRLADAAAVLGRLARRTAGFTDIPPGAHHVPSVALVAMAGAAITASGHDPPDGMEPLTDLLADSVVDGILIGWPTIYVGHRASLLSAPDGR